MVFIRSTKEGTKYSFVLSWTATLIVGLILSTICPPLFMAFTEARRT